MPEEAAPGDAQSATTIPTPLVRKEQYGSIVQAVLDETDMLSDAERMGVVEQIRYLVGKESPFIHGETREAKIAAKLQEIGTRLTRHEMAAAVGSATFVLNVSLIGAVQMAEPTHAQNEETGEILPLPETPIDSGNQGMGPDGPLQPGSFDPFVVYRQAALQASAESGIDIDVLCSTSDDGSTLNVNAQGREHTAFAGKRDGYDRHLDGLKDLDANAVGNQARTEVFDLLKHMQRDALGGGDQNDTPQQDGPGSSEPAHMEF